MHRGGQAENCKELLSRPRGQLMVALGQVWPLRPGCSFHCRQRNGHRAETGCWPTAHSGWQPLGLWPFQTTRAVPPHGGLGILSQELLPPVILDPGLGRGFPVGDVGPCSAQPPGGRPCMLLKPPW